MSKSKVPHEGTEFDPNQLGKMYAIGPQCQNRTLCSSDPVTVIVDPVVLLVEGALSTVSTVKPHFSYRDGRGNVVRRENKGTRNVDGIEVGD